MSQYFIIYKPHLVLSQFSLPKATASSSAPNRVLKDFFKVPKDVYPVGRLDYDSEGLMILTDDNEFNHRLLNPSFAHEREYWVQVEGKVTDESMEKLRTGVSIKIDGNPYRTKKAIAEKFETAPLVPVREPPIRFRKNIPDTWIRLILTEGKNRQVRKMTASVGNPTLRLIRSRIERLTIEGLAPGSIKELEKNDIYDRLFRKNI